MASRAGATAGGFLRPSPAEQARLRGQVEERARAKKAKAKVDAATRKRAREAEAATVSLTDRMKRDVEIHRRDLAEVDEIADRLVVRHDRAATLRGMHRTHGAHHGRPTDGSPVELEGRASLVLGAIPVDVHQRHLGRVVRAGDEHPVIAHVDHLADLQIVAGHGFTIDTEATGRITVFDGDELAAVQARRTGDEFDPVFVGHPVALGAHAGFGIDIENGERALVAGLHGEDETLARPRGVGEVLPLPRQIPLNRVSLAIESDDGERDLGIVGAGAGIPDRTRSLSRRDGCGNPPRVDRRDIDSFDEQSLRVGCPPETASTAHLLAGDELCRPPRNRVAVLVDHAAVPLGIDHPKAVIGDVEGDTPLQMLRTVCKDDPIPANVHKTARVLYLVLATKTNKYKDLRSALTFFQQAQPEIAQSFLCGQVLNKLPGQEGLTKIVEALYKVLKTIDF